MPKKPVFSSSKPCSLSYPRWNGEPNASVLYASSTATHASAPTNRPPSTRAAPETSSDRSAQITIAVIRTAGTADDISVTVAQPPATPTTNASATRRERCVVLPSATAAPNAKTTQEVESAWPIRSVAYAQAGVPSANVTATSSPAEALPKSASTVSARQTPASAVERPLTITVATYESAVTPVGDSGSTPHARRIRLATSTKGMAASATPGALSE